MLATLMIGLKIQPCPLSEVAADWSRRGIGLSDMPPVAPALHSRWDYTNTYLHRFPRVDITTPPDDLVGELEFVICSDVLEHVPPPVELALERLLSCLRPGGFAVVTVPTRVVQTAEHYPGLREHEVRQDAEEEPSVAWRDAAGEWHVDHSPDVHGGPGQTLAFRDWAATDLLARLRNAGFTPVWQPPAHDHLGVPEIRNPGIFLAHRPETAGSLGTWVL